MLSKNLSLLLSLVVLVMMACTPKVTETASAPPPPPPKVEEESLSDCNHWTNKAFKDKAETLHVLYKDNLRSKNYEEAFRLWKEVYELAPAADGKRPDHYLDGIKIYAEKARTTTDATEKAGFVQRIMSLYDEASKCYPKNESIYTGLKAFDLYYKYQDQATDMEKYKLFKESIDADGEKASDFVINPFTSLLIQLFLDKKIDLAEAQKYAALVPQIIKYGTSEATTTKAKNRWSLVEGYAPVRLEEMEGVEGFYDCDYYKAKYIPLYEADSENCEIVGTTYGRLKWGKCPEVDEKLTMLAPKVLECFPPPPKTEPTILCSNYLREGNYSEAVSCYEGKAAESSNQEKVAQYNLVIAKIYYAHLKRYSQARKYALRAAAANPNWGDPYILIGKLYASSGPLCGPGRGWDSQIVTWPAIDMWAKAKSVDSSVASEANKLINRYTQFMPNKEDIFQRNLTEGGSFKVGCWIQRSTKIRAAKN